MRVAIVTGPRSAEPMGLELAESRLLAALRQRAGGKLDVRVVGRRTARRHARRVGARWVPALRASLPTGASSGADLVHLLGLDLPPPRKTPFVAMVHDLAPLRYDDEGSLPPWTEEIVERARLLFTPSGFIAGELTERFGVPSERIRVVGGAPALEARDAEPLTSVELAELGIEPPYVLRYGGYTRRKNVGFLLESWSGVEAGSLVLAGPPQPERAALLRDAPSLDRVLVLDYVPSELLARLLKTAAALASTSIYEGFGLPPLEALAAGTPVAALSEPFVTEICADAALYCDGDALEMGGVLRRVLTDAALADSLRAAGLERAAAFGWPRVAEAVAAGYAAAMAR
jgi:glycosyltransferase involved in cell wall biosynthesis